MSEWEPRPTLLYFHHDHEHKRLGKTTLKQCKLLDSEKVARWSHLFHMVEVDMDGSDTKILKRFKAKDKPSFAVVDRDLNVVVESKLFKSSKDAATFLKTTLQSKFPKYWAEVKERLTEQSKLLKEGQKHLRRKELQQALNCFHDIRVSDLRIAPYWDEVVREATKLEKEIADEG